MTQPSFLGSLNHVRGLEQHQHERPYEIWLDQEDYYPTDQAKTNIVLQLSHNICIRDARSVGVRNFSIEEQGFQFIEHSMPKDCKISGNTDVNASLAQRTAVLAYINIMGDLLCQKFGGSKAICYDWRIRRAQGSSPATRPRLSSLPENVDARIHASDVARQVHADASPNGIKQTLDYVLTLEEKESVQQGKWRIRVINIWRPLVPVVVDEALALCDRRTVTHDDWVTLDKVHTRWIEESMYMKHRDSHQWYYLSNQTRDEVTAMLIWDSHMPHDRSASVPYSAVQIPDADKTAEPRESIEVRYIMLEHEG